MSLLSNGKSQTRPLGELWSTDYNKVTLVKVIIIFDLLSGYV